VTLEETDSSPPYARFVFSLLAALVPAAPVGLYKAAEASGAFLRSESISVHGLWIGIGVGTLIAAPLFWLFMKVGSPNWSPSLIRVAIVASLSAVCLSFLGQAAAATDWLDDYVAGAIWLLAMLTLGALPFVKAQKR
jgi:hypothetical protein